MGAGFCGCVDGCLTVTGMRKICKSGPLLFGANRGPRPSADGLAFPTKTKTF